MSHQSSFIWITAERELLHQYPDAPESVSFLKQSHRHLFKFKVHIEVFDDDRDIEFILFKRFVDDSLDTFNMNVGAMSCEMISDTLWHMISGEYNNRKIKIEVSEDGENGSFKEYLARGDTK